MVGGGGQPFALEPSQIIPVSISYTDSEKNWLKSAVWDKEGELPAVGKEWGKVLVVEVDLDEKKQ